MAVDVAVSVVGTIGGESVIGRDCGVDGATGSMMTVRVEVRSVIQRTVTSMADIVRECSSSVGVPAQEKRHGYLPAE